MASVPLQFPRSDGDPSHDPWPTKRDFDPNSGDFDGEWRPVALDEVSAVSWRRKVGKAIAEHYNMAPGNYALVDWPEHYRMFEKRRLGGLTMSRTDIYLIGSQTIPRFRSPNEFAPHAIWLFGPESELCACDRCSKATRVPLRKLENSSRKPSPPPKRSIIHAEIRAFRLDPIVLDDDEKISDVYDRLNDIRASNRKEGPTICREGELVWCALPETISVSPEEGLNFWPGVVKNVKFTPSVKEITVESTSPWTACQLPIYTIHLLGVHRVLDMSEVDLIPYQAYSPTDSLIQAIAPWIPQELNHNDESFNRDFDPYPDEKRRPEIIEVAAPCALAIEIAHAVSKLWSLTDEWEFQYAHPPGQTQQISNLPLDSPEVVTTNSLGITPRPGRKGQQTRFQGLWWGGERIWVEDMVRLKLARNQLAPEGNETIFRPSEATKEANQRVLEGTQISAGPDERSTFLRLEGITVVNVPRSHLGRFRKEIRLCGTLYELADIEYEDPNTHTLRPIYPNGQISSPGIPDPLPLPPKHCKFRQIQPEGAEFIVSLTLLAGRYYPLSACPGVQSMLRRSALIHSSETKTLLALDGSAPGFFNCSDPIKFALDRQSMFEEAHKHAIRELVGLKGEMASAVDEDKPKTPLFLAADEDEPMTPPPPHFSLMDTS